MFAWPLLPCHVRFLLLRVPRVLQTRRIRYDSCRNEISASNHGQGHNGYSYGAVGKKRRVPTLSSVRDTTSTHKFTPQHPQTPTSTRRLVPSRSPFADLAWLPGYNPRYHVLILVPLVRPRPRPSIPASRCRRSPCSRPAVVASRVAPMSVPLSAGWLAGLAMDTTVVVC